MVSPFFVFRTEEQPIPEHPGLEDCTLALSFYIYK